MGEYDFTLIPTKTNIYQWDLKRCSGLFLLIALDLAPVKSRKYGQPASTMPKHKQSQKDHTG